MKITKHIEFIKNLRNEKKIFENLSNFLIKLFKISTITTDKNFEEENSLRENGSNDLKNLLKLKNNKFLKLTI